MVTEHPYLVSHGSDFGRRHMGTRADCVTCQRIDAKVPVPATEVNEVVDIVRIVTEVRETSETGGQKGSKPAKFSMIPQDILWELAEHYGRGERKYPSDPETHEPNWQKGYSWSLSVDALHRHLSAWLQGEDTDEETGSSHLLAVMWHAMALRWWQLHGRGTDDLPGRQS